MKTEKLLQLCGRTGKNFESEAQLEELFKCALGTNTLLVHKIL